MVRSTVGEFAGTNSLIFGNYSGAPNLRYIFAFLDQKEPRSSDTQAKNDLCTSTGTIVSN
jgi:hypothetical protein